MRVITKSELRELAAHGEGVVLVDRHGRGDDRPSTLHCVTCSWPMKTSAQTPLLYEISFGMAFRWLTTHRGAEGEGWKRCGECRASAAQSVPSRRGVTPDGAATIDRPEGRVGQPVWTMDRGRDVGWVTAVVPETMRVAGFDSASNEAFDERQIDADAAGPFLPRAGDRCFIEEAGEWVAAICNDDALDVEQFVSVSCGGREFDLPLTALRFRRLASLVNPVAELAEQRVGSMSRYIAHAHFSDSYWRLAAPSRGLLGVSSAAVHLHPHQIGVARRILADPVQRYLLADEVGLGKTIEAGFVIRQRLIDAPRSVVRVLVPDALIWQWESELESKFAISQLGGVELFAFGDRHAFDAIQTPDLVVIDEAHRIAAGWNSPAKELSERFEAARSLAHRVPRILLLSATPVLHREADLLAMLHLLDPDTYRLEDVDLFKARIVGRERIGELLLALRPGAPTFLLKSRLPDLREAFPKDARMAEYVERVASLLDGDPTEREAALADARSHLSETYRLHRRLLRNRRSAIEGTDYTVRGRLGIEVLHDGDRRREAVDAWLERWRVALLEDAHELGAQDAIAKAVQAFLVYVACSSGDLSVLLDLVRFKLTWKRSYREAAGLPADEAAAVRVFPISERQRAVLGELLELLDDSGPDAGARAADIAIAILGLKEEAILIFAPSEVTAEALQGQLVAAGEDAQTYTAGRSDLERRAAATAFAEGGTRRFLICDRTGEEGLNLQVADCIVHIDLPLSTTRIEQRIGRVDRHGEAEPVRNYVVEPGPGGGFEAWWLEALTNSFQVFDRTTAPLQYAIETVQGELLKTLALEGVDEALASLRLVNDRVNEEQARIDKLDSLDALARQETDDVQFVESALALEAALADEFSKAFLQALRSTQRDLQVRIDNREGSGCAIRVSAERPAIRSYPGVFDREFVTTADRPLAVTDPNLTLLRPGSPLVEALRLHLAWDERCQTAAVWVYDERYDEPVLAVRCDLIVRADPSPAFVVWKGLEATRPRMARATRTDADAPLAVAALQRRLDAYFPPRPTTIWIDRHGEVIDDAEVVSALSQCITTVADQHWTDDHWKALARHCGALSADDVLMPLGPLVQGIVLADPLVDEAVRVALSRARLDWEEAERALRLRADFNLDASIASRDLADERNVADHLLTALGAPIVDWSGAALVFLTAHREFE